jgi:hypothetical protein
MNSPIQHRLGVGYNPQYGRGDLTFPPAARYVEAGAALLRPHVLDHAPWPADVEVSLHLSRAPMCEPLSVQRLFAERLRARLPAAVRSLGLHLCGELRRGLGAFGFGTAFSPEGEHEQRTLDFVRLVEDELTIPVVIENANYYDRDLRTSLRVLDFMNELTVRTKARLIVDLAHMTMCAHNLGVAPSLLLGHVHTGAVSVLHFSGIHASPSGAMHDGHQHPVHSQVWQLGELLLDCVAEPCTLVLEHTDPRWSDTNPAFALDVARLSELCKPRTFAPRHTVEDNAAALGYLAHVIVPHCFPALAERVGRGGIEQLLRAWCPEYLSRVASASAGELPVRGDEHALYPEGAFDPLDDFTRFLGRKAVS